MHERTHSNPAASWPARVALGAALLLTLLAAGCHKLAEHDGDPCDDCCGHELPEGGEARAKALVERMVAEVGSMDELKARGDVEYTYTYGDPASGEVDVSLERYVFEGERSWARYETRKASALPDLEGTLVQGYDGERTWATLDGELVTDPKALRLSDFLRKTNFYWLTMMQKLLDPGMRYAYEGTRSVDGLDYEIVKVGFEDGVGDYQDTYVLYLNPKTKLVDRFLFTVADFGRTEEPLLMIVEHEDVGGVILPTKRRYADARWDGTVTGDDWTHELCENLSFGHGFEPSLFEKPAP